MKHGDFTDLADNYAKYRPGYSPFVLDSILGLTGKMATDIIAADVGAGTGIWSRMLADRGMKVSAVEPNEAMLKEGVEQNNSLDITWHGAAAEATGLPDNAFDLVSMASSFHWPDFDQAVAEFQRTLKPNGYFVALWNPRRYESNSLLVDVENKLKTLVPEMKRVSSGRSEFCDSLLDRLGESTVFDDVLYIEGRHIEKQSPERYIGLWKSVNDVRVQAGPERFETFLNYIRDRISDLPYIEAEYTTRAWVARLKS